MLKCVLDLSTAFDKVSHPILLCRLEEDFGVRGSALLWMESNFSGRTQAVNIDSSLSTARPLTTGMPGQGFQIGPSEFPPYTSPMFAIIAEKHDIKVSLCGRHTAVLFKLEDYFPN